MGLRIEDRGLRIEVQKLKPLIALAKPSPSLYLAPFGDYFDMHMDQSNTSKLKLGSQVRVIQQIAARNHTWTSDIRGTVVDFSQKQTGSWYAHSKDDKLWLDRLTLKKPDGELITLNLDDYSVVEVDPA